MKRIGAVGAALMILAFASGCAAAPSSGPMDLGGPDRWQTCVPSQGQKVSVGDAFAITGHKTAKLSSLRLVNAQGVELDSSFVLPPDDGYVGADTYPPTISTWGDRIPVSGATIEPGGEQSFLLVLKPVGDGPHTTEGFIANYEVDGKVYENSNFVSIEIRERCGEGVG